MWGRAGEVTPAIDSTLEQIDRNGSPKNKGLLFRQKISVYPRQLGNAPCC